MDRTPLLQKSQILRTRLVPIVSLPLLLYCVLLSIPSFPLTPKYSNSVVDFELFLRILNRPDGFRPPGQPEDFVRGFQVFDKDGTGLIGVGELKYGKSFPCALLSVGSLMFTIVLTNLGEKLSDDEVEELLKGVNVGKDGSINYNGSL